MKRLLIPTVLACLMFAPQAQAGYFAFHADISGHLGDFGRPDSDDEPTCDDSADSDCQDQDDNGWQQVILNAGGWANWLIGLLSL